MMPAAKHPVLVVVDSDVLVGPGFIDTIVAPLAEPGIGCVTCMYKGAPAPDLASRLGALYISDWFIPSVLVDLGRHEMSITYGAAAAVTREVLDKVGGFAAMANAVAQDYVLGHEIRRAGYKIRLAPAVVATVVAENGLAGLYRHEVRWMRAIRAVRPGDHLLWILTSALVPLALLATAWPLAAALPALAIHLALRLAIHTRVRRRIALPPSQPWLIPVREVANFVLWAGSLLSRRIRWGGNVMVTGDGLTMHRDQPSEADHRVDQSRYCKIGGQA
jgi:ceramide glucosyltransferase